MTLPINIEKLIKGQVVETGRIEHKDGWNPVNEVREWFNNFPKTQDILNPVFGWVKVRIESLK